MIVRPRYRAALLCVVFFLALLPTRLVAQSTAPKTLLVTSVRFNGKPFFSNSEISLHIRTRPNRRFLGIPGFRWWLWLYRFGDAVGGGIGRALMATGEPPAYLDSTVVAADVERLRLFYAREGFRSARVSAQIGRTTSPDHVKVLFTIQSGAPTFIRHVQYDGVNMLDAEQRKKLTAASLIPHRPVFPDDTLQFTARNQRYSAPTLLDEGRRLLTFLRNQGYAATTRDSIHAIIIPSRPHSFDVIFRVNPGERFRFGDVHFAVVGPQPRAKPRSDTLTAGSHAGGGQVTVKIRGEGKLDVDLLTRTLRLQPGDWYDQERLLATKRRLDATGVFAFSDVISEAADSTRNDPTQAPRLPHTFELRTRRRHQIRIESFMLQRSGALADVDNELGAGLGFTYQNLNLFGGGETFRLRTTGSLAADLNSKFGVTSSQLEITSSLTYPYLVWPFQRFEDKFNLFNARTHFSISFLAARREALRLVLRGRGTARFQLELQHAPAITSFVDLLDLSINNPDTLSGFKDAFLTNVLASIQDTVQQAQIIEDYTRPQINNALRYTLRSARFNPLTRSSGYSYEGSIELGGNLPYLLDRYIFTPGTVEGTIPGLPIFGGDRSGNRLLYRQYVRLVGDARRYIPVTRRAVFAWKALVGIAHPTGKADVVP